MKVVNFSDITLPHYVLNLLFKGANFCFLNSFYPPNLEFSKLKFIRDLRFKHHFLHSNTVNNTQTSDLIIHEPTKNDPPIISESQFEKSISLMEDRLTPWIKSKTMNNFQKAWNFIKNNRSLKITKADKGGALVVMNKDQYEKLVFNHLDDKTTYVEIPDPMNELTHKTISQLITDNLPCFLSKERNYLLNASAIKTPYFYVLPKIHKHHSISEVYTKESMSYLHLENIQNLESRPIISNISSPTSKLSHFIDILLKPLIDKVPGYIKNSFDLLEKLPNRIHPDSLFISMDVNSLYTNIPNDLGIEALTYWVSTKFNCLNIQRFSPQFIIEGLKIVLLRNTFSYNNRFFHQISGTAMGTKVAPTYAHLVMAYLEITLFKRSEIYYGKYININIKNNYWRYLDDILIIWSPDFGDHKVFIDIMTNLNPNISFKLDINASFTSFLDLKLLKANDKIETDINYKTTDSRSYLHFQSLHPRHIKRNIPYNLAFRIYKLVSSPNMRKIRLLELKDHLLALNYPENLVNDAINKSYDYESGKPKEEKILPFIIPSNINSSKICNSTFYQGFKDIINRFFINHKLLICKTQPPNLIRHLNRNFNFSIRQCSKPKCKTCKIIIEKRGGISINNHFIKFNCNMNCTTDNVIYVLFCNGCTAYYVGETGNSMNIRINLHRNHIVKEGFLPVSKHIKYCCGAFKVIPIYRLPIDSIYLRRQMENYFIKVLKPRLNAI